MKNLFFEKTPLFLFLLFLIPHFLLADSYIDSLETVINSQADKTEVKEATFLLGEYLVQRNPEQAEAYADILRDLPSVNKDSVEWSRMMYIYAASHRWQGNYKTALDYYQKLYDYFKSKNDLLNVARSGKKIGSINTFLGHNVMAQKHLLECGEIYNAEGTDRQKAMINNSIAGFYVSIEHEEKGKERYLMALKGFQALNDSAGLASANANLGMIYANQGDFDKAEKHLQAQKIYNRVFATGRGMGFHHDFMGILRQKQGRLNEAFQEHLKALEIRKSLSSTYNLCESRLNTGEVLIKLKKYKEAIFHLKEVLKYEEHESYNQEERAHELLSKAYEKLNDYPQALMHYKAFKTKVDTLYNRESIQVIAEKDALYKRNEQDSQIALLSKEKEIAQAKLSRSNMLIYGGLVGLLLFSLFSFFIYRLYKKIKAKNEIIKKALQEKSLLLQEIHHRVKNNLQVISSLLRLQSKFITDESALEAIKDGRNRVQSMAILHQNLYREEDITGVNMKTYFTNLVEGIFNSYNLSKDDIQLNLEIEDLNLDVDTVIPIGLITNELVTNSLKYAFGEDIDKAVIEVKLSEINGEYQLIVSDNGIGMDEATILQAPDKTFGQRMIHAFVNKLKAQIRINNVEGTKVIIDIPK